MPYVYRPRGMPARYMEGSPAIVKAQVLIIHGPHSDTPCPYDVMFKPEPAPRREVQITGLDFDAHGAWGCHFFLESHQAAAYRARNRRKRIAWRDLPEPTQRAIVAYLEA